jgi:hypothetical protein
LLGSGWAGLGDSVASLLAIPDKVCCDDVGIDQASHARTKGPSQLF